MRDRENFSTGWKQRLREWVYAQRDKNRCGLFPAQTGRWDPFTKCCTKHDIGYIEAGILVAEGIFYKDDSLKTTGYDLAHQTDKDFEDCTENKAKSYNIVIRPVTRLWADIYQEIVYLYGPTVFEERVQMELKELRNTVDIS